MISWSYSRLKVFETCPAQYKGKYIDRVPDPQTEASVWGDRVHEALEKAVRDDIPVPPSVKPYQWAATLGQQAKAAGALVRTEYEMGLTEKLKPCKIMAADVWLRGIADLYVVGKTVAAIWDYKSGNRRGDLTQLKIMAAMTFQYEPQIARVEARYLWLKEKKQNGVSINREQLPPVWEDLIARAQRIERAHETGIFQARPGWACKYCPVKTCRYNEKRAK